MAWAVTWRTTDQHLLASSIFGVDITEVYSPVRVHAVVAQFGLTAGFSMDLTKGWDFSKDEHMARAMKNMRQEEPYYVIGSPPRTMFSLLQVKGNDQEWFDRLQDKLEEPKKHIELCCLL